MRPNVLKPMMPCFDFRISPDSYVEWLTREERDVLNNHVQDLMEKQIAARKVFTTFLHEVQKEARDEIRAAIHLAMHGKSLSEQFEAHDFAMLQNVAITPIPDGGLIMDFDEYVEAAKKLGVQVPEALAGSTLSDTLELVDGVNISKKLDKILELLEKKA